MDRRDNTISVYLDDVYALAAGFNKAESSRVVLFLNLGPKWLKKFSEVLYAVIVIGFFGFMVIYGWELVMQQKMLNEMGTALRIPMTIIGFAYRSPVFWG